jgi:hypothetical protein
MSRHLTNVNIQHQSHPMFYLFAIISRKYSRRIKSIQHLVDYRLNFISRRKKILIQTMTILFLFRWKHRCQTNAIKQWQFNWIAVQVEQSGTIPFDTAIVFLLNCVDLLCKGLYDCFTIIDKLAGDIDVACARCSNNWSSVLTRHVPLIRCL